MNDEWKLKNWNQNAQNSEQNKAWNTKKARRANIIIEKMNVKIAAGD